MSVSEAIRLLRQAGVAVEMSGSALVVDSAPRTFVVPRRRPTPHDLAKLTVPSVVYADRVSSRVVAFAEEHPDITLVTPNVVVTDGRRIDLAQSPVTPVRPRGRVPWARHAIQRILIAFPSATQVQLAELAGVSQASVSNALSVLDATLTPVEQFDAAVSSRPDAGGQRYYWYSNKPLHEQAADLRARKLLLTGDFAADAISAWRTPEHAHAYSRDIIDLSADGYVLADERDYTTLISVPADPTPWATAHAWDLDVADPIVAACDILSTARAGDQTEAVDALRKFVEHHAR